MTPKPLACLLLILCAACGGTSDPTQPPEMLEDAAPSDAPGSEDVEEDLGQEDTPVAPPDIVEDTAPDATPDQCVEDSDCGRSGACVEGVCLTRLRVATWNVEGIGPVGSAQFEAALAVVRRIGAEVIALQEVDGAADVVALSSFAAQAGYPHVALLDEGFFGSERNAFLSALPFESVTHNTSASLSGDPEAADITRAQLEVVVVPEGALPLTLIVHHAKSGAANRDEFRRVCESFRLAQTVGDLDPDAGAFVFLGDFNEAINAGTQTPEAFEALPEGLPPAFTLGEDLVEALAEGGGLQNNPFFLLQRPGGPQVAAVEAFQIDGSPSTRPGSGRQIDYILVSRALQAFSPDAEVYSAELDASQGGGLPKRPPALEAETTEVASDHLPVFTDLLIGREVP